MKPLNQTERSTRLWKFTLFYLAALALPLVASYYLFSNGAIADENQKLKKELERSRGEQQQLLTQLDTLTSYLRRIDATDRQLRSETNDLVIGELNKRAQDYVNSIAVTMSEVRRDSSRMQQPVNKRIAQNILRDFDLFRSNRNTIDFLRQSLDKRGIDVSDKEKVTEELNQTKQLLAICQSGNKNVQPPPQVSNNNNNNSGNAGRLADMQRRLQESTTQVALLSDQVNFANADCLRLRAVHAGRDQRKEMLEQARKGFVTIYQNPSSEDMKNSVEKMIDLIDKELGRKRGIFR